MNQEAWARSLETKRRKSSVYSREPHHLGCTWDIISFAGSSSCSQPLKIKLLQDLVLGPLLFSPRPFVTFIQCCGSHVFCMTVTARLTLQLCSALEFQPSISTCCFTSPPGCLNLMCSKPNFPSPPLPFPAPLPLPHLLLSLQAFRHSIFPAAQDKNLRVIPDFFLPYPTSSPLVFCFFFFLSLVLAKTQRESLSLYHSL